MGSEELEEDARRYIWVPFMSDAFRTNAEGEVVELSDVVELESARTSEAMRVPPDASSLGLYKIFHYNGHHDKINARLRSYVP